MLSLENREILKTLPIYQKIGFEFNDGWTPLIYTLGKNISLHCDLHSIPLPEMRQIKEKFGTLRFYYSNNHDKTVRAMVREAEDKSEFICETCGNTGQLLCAGGIWHTACVKHAREGSMTAQEFKIQQELGAKERRKCDICGKKGSDGYYDPKFQLLTNRCQEHREDFVTSDEHFAKITTKIAKAEKTAKEKNG